MPETASNPFLLFIRRLEALGAAATDLAIDGAFIEENAERLGVKSAWEKAKGSPS